MVEEWREIAEAPKYEVSNQRRVRNIKTGKILKENSEDAVNLMIDGRRICRTTWSLKKAAFPFRGLE